MNEFCSFKSGIQLINSLAVFQNTKNSLAPRVGFEPTTERLTAAYSTVELSGSAGCRAWIRTRARGFKVPRATTTQLGILFVNGAEGRARTDMEDLPPTVFETAASTYSATSAYTRNLHGFPEIIPDGAEDEIRTRDPLLGKEMLYH